MIWILEPHRLIDDKPRNSGRIRQRAPRKMLVVRRVLSEKQEWRVQTANHIEEEYSCGTELRAAMMQKLL